ncbi:efflux RND transporter permease subunit [Sinorhizobium alkalisoli]|uniref:Acriflavin resistance protein n=1 Tax=Sinorhizobium alkalisoli TaxID=1752398 RepID=A0A1E3VI11_9HYPH|nr:efflux RND transporter permease subunit [Sinorhizobium alkalisoli]MCG5480235.1 efflux RND transporter permease subunit [Sinorhizobium alkalisoli]ODR93213.1 acriflavin resistance protein [Sinorhizobium alkalisoli]
MMRWIIEGSLKIRFFLVFAAAMLVFFGVGQLRGMRTDVFPEFAPPLVEIQTEALGLSAEEVESLVTLPLELSFAGTPGLETMRSKSVPGLSSVVLIFKRGTDLFSARQLVQERLAAAKPLLPNVARPPFIIQPLSATSRVMKIGLSSSEMSLVDLSEVYRWTIRPRLMRVPGVANVAAWGVRKRQLQVQVDPERLRAFGITLDQVLETTGDALDVGLLPHKRQSKTQTGGLIDAGDQRLNVRHVLPVVSPENLSRVAFPAVADSSLRLGDIADVVQGHPPMIGDGIVNDGPGLLLIVEKFPWANTLDVTEGVDQALELLGPGLPGIAIDPTIFRPATFIEMSLDNLTKALIVGSILVVLVLVAFLYQWRAAVISLVAIPLSLVAAGLVLDVMGATINTMILAGFAIALGAVVDDAIIDVENIVRRLRENRRLRNPKPIATVVLEASLEIRRAIVYATLIIILAVLPVFFLDGLSGAFFKPLALAYTLALFASMLVALTVTPALSLILYARAPLDETPPAFLRTLQGGYSRLLSSIIRAPRAVFVITGTVTAIGFAVLPLLGNALLPDFKERDFLMHWVTKPGTSYPEMNRITIKASAELRNIPGVRNFGAHVGRAVASDEVVGINFTENWVSVAPEADYDKTLAAIQEVVDGYPGLYRDVQTYLKERIREVLTGASEALVVRIYGPELNVLRAKAADVKKALGDVAGLVALHTELQEDIPHITIQLDLAAAKSYGIKPGDVRRAAATILAGIEVSDIYRGPNLYDVVVWGIPEARHDVGSIRDLLIDTPTGGHVRLADIAEVKVAPTPNVIKHERVSRRIDVSANVKGRDLGSVVSDVKERLARVEFPPEYHPELVGEYAEREAAERNMMLFSVGAATGIFFLLQASFASWRLALLAYLLLPAALVGGLLAAYAGDGVISLGSLVGFLTVLGIAARNGVLLVDHFQHLEQYEGESFGPGLVLRGASERLSPILMTVLTTGLAIIPLVYLGQVPGNEIEHPMAVVIIGGLVTSTLLNLFVLPSLYLHYGSGIRRTSAGPNTAGVEAAGA